MKIIHKRILCYILAIMILMTGICFEDIKSLSWVQNLHTESSASFCDSYDATVSTPKYCTLQMLSTRGLTFTQHTTLQSLCRRDMRTPLHALITTVPAMCFSTLFITILTACIVPHYGESVAVRYIHNSDGEK